MAVIISRRSSYCLNFATAPIIVVFFGFHCNGRKVIQFVKFLSEGTFKPLYQPFKFRLRAVQMQLFNEFLLNYSVLEGVCRHEETFSLAIRSRY